MKCARRSCIRIPPRSAPVWFEQPAVSQCGERSFSFNLAGAIAGLSNKRSGVPLETHADEKRYIASRVRLFGVLFLNFQSGPLSLGSITSPIIDAFLE